LSNLKAFSDQYAEYLRQHPFRGTPTALYEPMNYIMSLGGKRVRPLLALLGADACGGQPEHPLPLAHAVEVFHNFSLVHDDIMDNAPTRRGKATVHEKWGIAEGILSGDNMLIAVYQMLLDYPGAGREEVLGLMTRTAREVCEGQQMDMDSATASEVTEAAYLEMIRLKTAVLLGCSLQCGAISAGADRDVQQLLYDFGINLGLSFQLNDDWLDAFGDAALTGKKPGGDIEEGKKTWLYIKAVDKSQIQELWNRYKGEERVTATLGLFYELSLDKNLKALADSYHENAMEDLRKLEQHNVKTASLKELADWLQGRQH